MFLKWGQSDQSVPVESNYFLLQGYLRMLYSDVTDLELLREKLKLKLSKADGPQTGQKLHRRL